MAKNLRYAPPFLAVAFVGLWGTTHAAPNKVKNVNFSKSSARALIGFTLVCAAVLLLVFLPRESLAQSCIDDVTARLNVCTANDVAIVGLTNEEEIVCELGEQVELVLTTLLKSSISDRWDIGLFFALDGGDARSGICEMAFLPPPLAADGVCDQTGDLCFKSADCPLTGTCDDGASACNSNIDCPPHLLGHCLQTGGACNADSDCFGAADSCVGQCSGGQQCLGGYDPLSSFGPYFHGESYGDPADVCGDLEQGVDTYIDLNLSVPCLDFDGNGQLDISNCVSWDNSASAGSDGSPSCIVKEDTAPNTVSKCRCEYHNVANVFVQESTSICGNDIIEAGEECDGGACCSETCELLPHECDDGFFCNGEETCEAGACEPGIPPECGDGVSCTIDACDAETDTCSNTPDDSYCNDGAWCNGTENCDAAADCQAGIEPCALGETCDEVANMCTLPIEVSIDIKFCSDPNAFNCKSKGNGKSKGVLPITVFGSDGLDVDEIDANSLQLCLEDLSDCIGAPVNWSKLDRGNPNSDLGAAQCAFIDTDDDGVPEEQDFLNPDSFLDLDVTFYTSEVATVLGDFCDEGKSAVSQPLIVTGTTLDGIEIFSVPVPNAGVDQLVKVNK